MKFSCPQCKARYSVDDSKLPTAKTLRFKCKSCEFVIRLRRKEDNNILTDDVVQSEGPPAPPPPDTVDWFVIIAGKQVGPMDEAEVIDRLKRREIDRRSYAWREGMPEWLRLEAVEHFKELAEQVGDASWRIVTPIETPYETPAPDEAQPTSQESSDSDVTQSVEVPATEPASTGTTQSVEVPATETPAIAASSPSEPEEANVAPQQEPASTSADLLEAGADATLAMDRSELESILATTPAVETDQTPFAMSAPAPAPKDNRESSDSFSALSALSGAPTGESMSRDGFVSSLAGGADGKLLRGSTSRAANPDKDYINAPAGEATRVFMATAGVFDRQKKRKRATIISSIVGTIFTGIILLDLFGIYTIPGFGLFYDYTGIEDPNVGRAEERIEAKLQDKELTAEERKKLEIERKRLREKLLGLNKKPARAKVARQGTRAEKVKGSRGLEDKSSSNLTEAQRKMAQSVFGDKRKRKASVKLVAPEEIRMPNLPDGLSPEALYEVLQSNSASIGMCIAESARQQEKLRGRMEVQIEIAPAGSVNSVEVITAAHRGTKMASCTAKRIRTWKFPRFNGRPLTVVMPFVLSQGM